MYEYEYEYEGSCSKTLFFLLSALFGRKSFGKKTNEKKSKIFVLVRDFVNMYHNSQSRLFKFPQDHVFSIRLRQKGN